MLSKPEIRLVRGPMQIEKYLRELIKETVREVIREEIESGLIQPTQPIAIHRETCQVAAGKPRDPNSIIRPSELSEMLSVSKTTLWRWENDGQLPSRIKIANRAVGWRYRDIEQWLNRREAEGLN